MEREALKNIKYKKNADKDTPEVPQSAKPCEIDNADQSVTIETDVTSNGKLG